MPLHIKGKNIDRAAPSTGLLIEPEVYNIVHNDEELYAAVRAVGKAVVSRFSYKDMSYQEPITLTPSEFEETWRGD